ncbi:uncharacterized protein [Nicotiana tomentosiformis]|uniref:uncharacterized protein n=1 Tax=Nicotiana tomentosiformis TaxID=4098 RepID=UPI00388CCCC4
MQKAKAPLPKPPPPYPQRLAKQNDFFILDCDVDYEVPIILGRHFLAMGKDLYDIEARESLFGLVMKKWCMMAIFTDMVEDYLKVFMDYFLVVGDSFDDCLANLDKVLARCEETNLLLEKDAKFNFNDDCMRAFELLKLKLTTRLCLIELMCDASDVAVWAILGKCINKSFHPV